MVREVRVLGRDYKGELMLTCQYEREVTLQCVWKIKGSKCEGVHVIPTETWKMAG